jgi:hypothetical protein
LALTVVGAKLYTKEETILMLMSLEDFQVIMLFQLKVEIRELYYRLVGLAVSHSMNSTDYTKGSH